jgi:membrane protein
MNASGWLRTFQHPFRTGYKAIREFVDDDGPFISAGIAFFAFFSLFPLVLISVALLSYWHTTAEAVSDTMTLTAFFLPPDMVTFLDAHVRELFNQSPRIGLAGFLVLLWSGRQLFRAMEFALHKAWEIPIERNWLVANLLAMMLVLLCTAVVLGVGATSLALTWLSVTLRRVELPQPLKQKWELADALVMSNIHSWVIVPLAVATIFLLLYILLPSRRVPISMAVPGAVFSCLAWKFSTWIYLTIIVKLAGNNPFLATIWGILGILVWLYIEAAVFMLGAELVFVNLDEAERAALGTSPVKSRGVTGRLAPSLPKSGKKR